MVSGGQESFGDRDILARRGVAQSGSAPVWGTGGRRFESSRPDQGLGITILLNSKT